MSPVESKKLHVLHILALTGEFYNLNGSEASCFYEAER